MELFGLKFAPLRIPLERRLQTLAVIVYTALFIVAPFATLVLFVVTLFTWFLPLTLAYAAWMFYDILVRATSSRGGRRFEFVRRLWIWRYFRDYFPVELVKTTDLDPNKNHIFGYHPHGIMGCGAFSNFATDATGFSEKFPGITPHLLTLKANFRYPVLRGVLLWHGVCDVSKQSLNYILTKKGKGNAAIVVIGGAAEALEAKPGNYNLTLKERKGFVKMALRTGSCLVPLFSFGENDLFIQADNPVGSPLRRFQDKFKNFFGFSPPLFHGRGVFNYTFGILPYRKPVVTVVGSPIDVPLKQQPTQEDIDHYHTLYIDALSRLFDEHKTKYNVDASIKLNFT